VSGVVAYGVALDANGAAYVVGETFSASDVVGQFPAVVGPDTSFNNGVDGFVIKIAELTATPTITPTVTLTPTATATATVAVTPTATTTPVAGSCSPVRPAVRLTTAAAGNGQLMVTVTTDALALNSIRLGNGPRGVDGATVTFANGTTTGANGATFTLPASQKQTTFTVTRIRPGAVTVPFIVTDSCGEWPTFVGGGPTAF
jgi:hypothetical protein